MNKVVTDDELGLSTSMGLRWRHQTVLVLIERLYSRMYFRITRGVKGLDNLGVEVVSSLLHVHIISN